MSRATWALPQRKPSFSAPRRGLHREATLKSRPYSPGRSLDECSQALPCHLASLWLVSLRDDASTRIDSEFLHDTSSVVLDSSYFSLGKEVLLPYYANSWSVTLQAVAAAMQANDPHILAAMDGREVGKDATPPAKEARREEPSMFFFIVFGLVYEMLATASAKSSSSATSRQSTVIAALQTLKCLAVARDRHHSQESPICEPSQAGNPPALPTL
ncbi:hypothetical protein FB451DRAFT_1489674 [Mycena latifolia]|nr:hypothetical protein FB451DRAFT_1489674 [Mycena latifolia]